MSHFDEIGPVVTVPDCAYQLEISHQALVQRLSLHRSLTRPPTFLAGGRQVMFKDNASLWLEKHLAEWAAIQAAKAAKRKGG